MCSNLLILLEAESWLNTPYHHQAKLKGVGVDCCNLIAAIAENTGLIPPIELKPYSLQWHLHSSQEMMLQLLEEHGCRRIDVDMNDIDSWPLGSILCFQYGRACSHMGLLVEDHQVIHASIETNKVVKHYLDSDLINRIKYIYSYPSKYYDNYPFI